MTIFLNVLFILVSVLFFSGRLFEILFFMDAETGFLSSGRVVSGPLMTGLIILIARCCGVIIFSGKEESEGKRMMPGALGIVCAVLLAVSSVMDIFHIFDVGGFLGSDIMIILGCVGLLFFSLKGIKGDKSEKIPFVLTMLLPTGLCIDAALINVSSVENTVFLSRIISYIATFVFIVRLFKYVYSSSKFTPGRLYTVSMLNFTFSSAGGLARVIGSAAAGSLVMRNRVRDMGLVLLGFYSLYAAFYILPAESAKQVAGLGKAKSKIYDYDTDDEEEEEHEDKIYSIKRFLSAFKDDEEDTGYYDIPQNREDSSYDEETDFAEDVNKFGGKTISMLFDKKRAMEAEDEDDEDEPTGIYTEDLGKKENDNGYEEDDEPQESVHVRLKKGRKDDEKSKKIVYKAKK